MRSRNKFLSALSRIFRSLVVEFGISVVLTNQVTFLDLNWIMLDFNSINFSIGNYQNKARRWFIHYASTGGNVEPCCICEAYAI